MKLIIKSKKLETQNECNNDFVYLINQFFIPNNNIRYNEIKFCLKKNVDNIKISEIHLLVLHSSRYYRY